MDSTTQATIEKIRAQIGGLEEQILKHKQMVNALCVLENEPQMYPAEELQTNSSGNTGFRSDQFFGKPMATAVKEILEQRGARNLGALSLDDLFDTMKAGGFQFDNNNEQIAKRNLAITLSKNPAFMRVPSNNNIGLAEWYPNVKKKRGAAKENGSPRLTLADIE